MTNKNNEGNKNKEGNENNEGNKGNENNGVITIQEMDPKNLERVNDNKNLDIDSHIADKEGMISGCIIS